MRERVIDAGTVEALVRLALAGLEREYPNKPGHVFAGPDDRRSPREMHPVFFGHFDWHSSVHAHWVLVRALRIQPCAPFSAGVRDTLTRRLTREGLEAEAVYFSDPGNRSFERMYGWAWLMRLVLEIRTWDDDDARRWADHLVPLERVVVSLVSEYLPKLDWPVRCGFHPETSFPLAQLFDYAHGVGNRDLAEIVVSKARSFHLGDRDFPCRYEPSGNDFFSHGWNTADLMRRVIVPPDFARWLSDFLPGLATRNMGNMLEPATISDVSDGQILHLVGLNLSRAWAIRGIASVLSTEDPRVVILRAAADLHAEAALPMVETGNYEGEHWLGTFAMYLLSDVSIFPQSSTVVPPER